MEKRNGKTERRNGIELVAKKMLELNMPITDIVSITGLTEQELCSLKKNIK